MAVRSAAEQNASRACNFQMTAQTQPFVIVQLSEHKLSPYAQLFLPTPYSNSLTAITFRALLPNALHYPLDHFYQKDERAEPGELQASAFCHPLLSHGAPYLYRRAVPPFGRHPEDGGSRLFRYLGIVYQTTRCHVPEYFSPNTILVSTVTRAVDTHDTAINRESNA
jgi:hypothetical protein